MDDVTPVVVANETAHPRFLPAESVLEMPQQVLRGAHARSAAPPAPGAPAPRPFLLPLRRVFVFGAAIAMTAVAGYEMYEVFAVGGLTALELVVLMLFVVLFGWISFSCASALAGFCLQLIGPARDLEIDPDAPLPTITTRNALLLPTYNEDPRHVMARLQAVFESVAETGQIAAFDFFVLSDSTDPAIWVAEEAAYLELLQRTGSEQIFYRHRADNTARKAGNISEWV
ncbi:MAG TPA: glucan biosynthesis glucosyltransferase H, partial [Xanthobacteraceae bacterium]